MTSTAPARYKTTHRNGDDRSWLQRQDCCSRAPIRPLSAGLVFVLAFVLTWGYFWLIWAPLGLPASLIALGDPAVGQVSGPDGYRGFFSGMRTAFPYMSVAPETIVQDEDVIAIAYTITGTHRGPFGKIPPTGKKVKIRGVQISKFKDGKMVERWGSSDELGLLKQIGVVLA